MEDNLALNAGLMVKGDLKDAVQRGNVVIGYSFYREPDATNLELPNLRGKGLAETYADPPKMGSRSGSTRRRSGDECRELSTQS